jgi:hypothetical protein
MIDERCNMTVDIEEQIAAMGGKRPTKCKAIITYNSGRVENYLGKLKGDGSYEVKFQKYIEKIKQVPTVVSVKVVKI